jgi:two-component system cell cycle sensor histidine kinase PleC
VTAEETLRLEPTPHVRRVRLTMLLLATVAMTAGISSLYEFWIGGMIYAHFHWAYDQSRGGHLRHIIQATVYTAIALVPPAIVIFTVIARIGNAHNQLRAALAAAQSANTAKSRFLANMSHELRTPLNAVIGFSDVMSAEMFGPLLPRYRGYAQDIRKSGLHLLAIINDVLDISKAEAAEFRVHLTDTNLAAIFDEVEMLAMGLAMKAGIKMQFELEGEPLIVHADRVRLTQSLLNLVSNAIKFNRHGGHVTVRGFASGGEIQVEVRDTGIGMNADEIVQAFVPFVQIDTGFGRRFEGTGLGLPLTKMLVEAMKGTLEMESQSGVGTRIRVKMPAAAASPLANAA